jgi:hypothetical protein
VVRSSPSGAAVTVDGRWRGRTPLTLDNLRFGDHRVRVVRDGYAVATESVTLSAEAPTRTVSAELQRSRPAAAPAPKAAAPTARGRQTYTGAIYIDSRPRGARVTINGRAVGTTPVRVPEVPVGSHVVRLQLENYRDWTTTTRVTAGQDARVTGSLDPIR